MAERSLSYFQIYQAYRAAAQLAYGASYDASGVVPRMSGGFLFECIAAWRRLASSAGILPGGASQVSEYQAQFARAAFLRWEPIATAAYNATLPHLEQLVDNPKPVWAAMASMAFGMNNLPAPYSYTVDDVVNEVGHDLSEAGKRLLHNFVLPTLADLATYAAVALGLGIGALLIFRQVTA